MKSILGSTTCSLPEYMFFTHLLAWDWGSIISGHLDPFVTITPLSQEKSSVGSPMMFQFRISVGSARNREKSKSFVRGMPDFWTTLSQTSRNASRYSDPN